MKRRSRSVLGAGLTLGMLIGNVVLAAGPMKVRATKADEVLVAAGEGYFAWTEVKHRPGAPYRSFVVPPGGTPVLINTGKKEAALGGIDGASLVYSEGKVGKWDVRLLDLATGVRSDPPSGVNTSRNEQWPSISGDWVLFNRWKGEQRSSIELVNIVTGELRVLDARKGKRRVFPGQLNGDYAVWLRCHFGCDIVVYRVSTGETWLIDRGALYFYAASVDPDGTVYTGRSKPECGAAVKLVKYPLGSTTPVLVQRFPRGVDFTTTFVDRDPAGTNHVYFTRLRCSSDRSDIYEVVD